MGLPSLLEGRDGIDPALLDLIVVVRGIGMGALAGADDYAAAWGRMSAVMADPDSGDVGAAALALAPLFANRIAAMHAAMRGVGLTAVQLHPHAKPLIEANAKVVKLAFDDGAGRDVTVELAANGNAFLAGRRYDAAISRVSLSDAEIARTGILRVEADRENDRIVITFLTFDGKQARLRVVPAQPFAPEVEGNIPEASIAWFRNRPETASLAALTRPAMTIAEGKGATKGFFARLFDGAARQAHADYVLLENYRVAVAAEEDNWRKRPQEMQQVAEAVIRQFSNLHDGNAMLTSCLIAIGAGRVLAAAPAVAG